MSKKRQYIEKKSLPALCYSLKHFSERNRGRGVTLQGRGLEKCHLANDALFV